MAICSGYIPKIFEIFIVLFFYMRPMILMCLHSVYWQLQLLQSTCRLTRRFVSVDDVCTPHTHTLTHHLVICHVYVCVHARVKISLLMFARLATCNMPCRHENGWLPSRRKTVLCCAVLHIRSQDGSLAKL